jgi:ankyrin repeat protein
MFKFNLLEMFFNFSPKNIDIKTIMKNFSVKFETLSAIDKAKLVRYYLDKYHNKPEIITKMTHISSNEAMNNINFAINFVKLNCHIMIFNLSKTNNQKWLMYSCLWNLFRFGEVRSIVKKKFILKILKDNQINNECPKVQNVYIGCLSNLSLNPKYKEYILKLFDLETMKIVITKNDDDNILKSLCGLCANICVEDKLAELFIKKDLYIFIIKSMKETLIRLKYTEMNTTLLKNFMALINNLSNIDNFIRPIIKYDLYESLSIVKLDKTNNNLVEFYENTMLIIFQTNEINETTSLHLANKHKYKDLVLEKIQNNFDINTKNKHGNTILHESLINKDFNLAKYYILSNADINIKNNEDKSPLDLEKDFVELLLVFKNKVDNSYKKGINKSFENNCPLYEKFLINSVYQYIDNRKLMFEL